MLTYLHSKSHSPKHIHSQQGTPLDPNRLHRTQNNAIEHSTRNQPYPIATPPHNPSTPTTSPKPSGHPAKTKRGAAEIHLYKHQRLDNAARERESKRRALGRGSFPFSLASDIYPINSLRGPHTQTRSRAAEITRFFSRAHGGRARVHARGRRIVDRKGVYNAISPAARATESAIKVSGEKNRPVTEEERLKFQRRERRTPRAS